MNNISIFRDTLKMCRINDILAKSVEESVKGTRFYAADNYPALSGAKHEGRVILTPERTFEAAFSLAEKFPNSRIGVLNFASAVNPGGGVKLGANAQEECLCRCSTLYPCLDTDELMKSYYIKNRLKMNPLYSDACIYTPDVTVFKSDGKSPELLPEDKWIRTDVLTCAAPNLSVLKVSRRKQYELHISRGRHILTIAAANGIEVLVLGAFGCGAFMNHTETVAAAYRQLMQEFAEKFTEVRFAVVSSPEKPSANYRAFKSIFSTNTIKNI